MKSLIQMRRIIAAGIVLKNLMMNGEIFYSKMEIKRSLLVKQKLKFATN